MFIYRILMVIMVMVSIVTGCTNQPPAVSTVMVSPTVIPTVIPASATPMPSPTMTMLVEKHMVMAALKSFNDANSDFVLFMQSNVDIYNLIGESPYHVAFTASRQIKFALPLYKNIIINWNPLDNRYYDKLMKMKEAELYRIEYFNELIEMLINTLPTENDEVINAVHAKFYEWRDDKRNVRAVELQSGILKELNIHPDDVNFMYSIPEKPIRPVPPLSVDKLEGGQS